MESGHRFDAQTLHSFIQAVFRQMGSEEQEAKLVADHLIAANLAGHDSHGIGMIPSYVRSWSQGHLQINHHAKIVKEAGAVVTLDGDRAFGQVAAHEAMALGIEKAHQHGIAAVALHNSHHIGRIGYWAEQCAAAGFVSIHFVSVVGIPMVAPFHGRDSRFGTNPFCVVFPRKDKFPLLLDYATSAIAFGKTRVAWHKGVPVPPGCLIDVNGVPTTNPAVMQESPLGSLLTFAEHKGYALAAMCEILGGALSGGKTTHQETLQTSPDAILNCMTTIIINPELFGAPDCSAQTEAFAEWVKASPHDDDKPILLPGEWEVNTRRERQEQGIPLDAGSWQAICDAARADWYAGRDVAGFLSAVSQLKKSPSSGGRANKGNIGSMRVRAYASVGKQTGKYLCWT